MCNRCQETSVLAKGIPYEAILANRALPKVKNKTFPRLNLMEVDTCVNGHDVRDKASSLGKSGRGWNCKKCMALHQTRRRQATLKPADEVPYLKMEIKRLLAETNHKETLEKILELLDQPAWMPSEELPSPAERQG